MPDRERLAEFVQWYQQHVTGDEKSEAQTFITHLFRAFGHDPHLPDAAAFEFRVRVAGGTSFADFVWPGRVLFEMKSRGEDLAKHWKQAYDYWVWLVPDRPRYVVLCNFDEFRVYDFETQMDVPVDSLATAELPGRWGPLAFLAPSNPKPSFGNDHVAVTRDAADCLAKCFNKMLDRGVDRALAQRFILQMLVALFAEDIGLLEKYFIARLLDDCATPADAYDLLGGLFEAMNSPQPAAGGRFKGVRYFNGGLFAQAARVELTDTEIVALREAAKFDWSKVRPEIFGVLFEQTVGTDRRAFGQHFTHPADIMKIVGPTIVEPWREQIEGARTLKRLGELRERLHHYRVLDPACGSGNFLYVAYRELKRLEARLIERVNEFPSRAEPDQRQLSFLSAQNFFGLDINPLAVELAKVTMMIARKLAIDELHITEPALPLDNLDSNFMACDALISPVTPVAAVCDRRMEQGSAVSNRRSNDDDRRSQTAATALQYVPTEWPKADVIIGNPPFIGSRYLAKQHGYEYARSIYATYPDVPKMADYCVYWLRRAADHLPQCTSADPVAGRAGLVGTQNIRNGETRVGGLDHIAKTGTIIEAVDNQPWSGEANVHVSIVNWVKTQDAALLPKKRRLWFKVEPSVGAKKPRKPGTGPASKEYALDWRSCEHINSALSDQADVSDARELAVNAEPKLVFQGQNPVHEGFRLEPTQAFEMLKQNPDHREVVFPYLIAQDLVTVGKPAVWVIDFAQRDMLEAMRFAAAFEVVKQKVMPDVLAKAEREKAATGKDSTRWTRMAERWWQFRDYMPGTMEVVQARSRYIVCPRVTKRPTFDFVSRDIHPDGSLSVFGFADDYSFGILQSSLHWLWFTTKCSKLTERFRYTPESVFDTFPWPQFPTVAAVCDRRSSSSPQTAGGHRPPLQSNADARITAVASAARELRRVRAEALPKLKGGLRALYRTLELPGANPLKDAHAALDAAVLSAYGFDPKQDLLAQLLALNQSVAAKIERNEPVTAPGVPKGYPEPEKLVTEDCIRSWET